MTADKQYMDHTPSLFSKTIFVSELGGLRATIEGHLRACAIQANGSFVTGEALSHGGMLRRYGPFSDSTSPLWAVDSESRIGYDSRPERRLREAALRSHIGLGQRESMPRKLDTLGILADGNAAVVELKDATGDLERAVTQAACRVARFRELREREGYDLRDVIMGQARQRARVGLLSDQFPAMPAAFQLVPIVAAPVASVAWVSEWLAETTGVRARLAGSLEGLRFWRLSSDGALLEEHVV